ncbi:MAG: hypothetical protein ACI8RD_014910, partial [Bacillariaceae sp.]
PMHVRFGLNGFLSNVLFSKFFVIIFIFIVVVAVVVVVVVVVVTDIIMAGKEIEI